VKQEIVDGILSGDIEVMTLARYEMIADVWGEEAATHWLSLCRLEKPGGLFADLVPATIVATEESQEWIQPLEA
jgi:hypothetical protein